jgi:stearoyl-CoA desaturase (Delta-9 desaturase)
MASRIDVREPALRRDKRPAIALKAMSVGDEALISKPLLGVRYNSPAALVKNGEHIFYLFAKNVPALGAIAWIATQPTGWVEWSAFALFYVMNILSMSIGYHRFFTHKAFETSTPMRYAIAILAQLGTFGSLRRWVAEHRRHHAHSDRAGDIHSPYFGDHGEPLTGFKGWKYAHLGWVFNNSITEEAVYGKGVKEDNAILFADKFRIPIFFFSVIGLPAIWALAWGQPQAVFGTILIAGFLRGIVALHAIACVNSFGHIFGSQRFKGDRSRNNWLIAVLTLGEGWHNNHHGHPRAANTGLAWYEIDMTGWVLRLLEVTGLIWNVRWARLDADKVEAPIAGVVSGVLVGGTVPGENRREYGSMSAIKWAGGISAIVWMVVYGSGSVEWSAFALFYVLNMIGISVGYHRLFSHRTFKTSRAMEYTLGILAQMAALGSVLKWATDHRRHHALTDRPGDTHSPYYDGHGEPMSGFRAMYMAHFGWVLGESYTDLGVYGKELIKDPVVQFCHRTRFLWFFISVAVLPAIWGWALVGTGQAIIGTVLIGGFLRSLAALHAILSLNSFGHTYGYQNFKGPQNSQNNWMVALATMGEGWHNNHHQYANAAYLRFRWYEIDFTGSVILLLEKLGLVWDVKRAPKFAVGTDGELVRVIAKDPVNLANTEAELASA